jgi:pyruvate dehydrogenase E2 component (dihydrolipoamide acetyltransferase)
LNILGECIVSTIKEIRVPDLGSAAQSEVIEIAVAVGDTISVEDTLITLESEKASMDIPSPYAGKIKALKTKVGDKLATGGLILTLEVDEAVSSNGADKKAEEPVAKKIEPVAPVEKQIEKPAEKTVAPAQTPAPVSSSESQAFLHASPGVRRFARELGVDISQLKGTGPKERILKQDIQGFVKSAMVQGPAVSTGSGFNLLAAPNIDFTQFGETETQALTRIKKLTGQNLSRNWVLAPHVTQFEEVDITELEAFRKSQQSTLEKQGIKLTILAFLMKAVVASLKAFPRFNASLDAKGENLILKKYFNIGIAVDTSEGLVVPVIRDVDKKGLLVLAQELAVISEKARNKALTAADMQGSCFTISSLGGIGGTAFTPIINLPDVAILGVSKSAIKPVYKDNQFVPGLMLPLSLSYDHRVIDGAEGARFTVHLARGLADIRQLLL